MVRIVEYSRFPRMNSDTAPRIAFTRDLSASGMCIDAEEREPTGSMLRVTLLGENGNLGITVVDRVVWCRRADADRWRIGLESLTEKNLS